MEKRGQAAAERVRRGRKKRGSIRNKVILVVVFVMTGCLLMGAKQIARDPLAAAPKPFLTSLQQVQQVVEMFGTQRQQTAESEKQNVSKEKNSVAGAAATTTSGNNEAPAAASEWNMRLVNPWNPLPEGFEVKLTQLKNGQAVDERCYPDLQKMMDDCRAAGNHPVICSSYRTQEKQQRLFNNQVNKLIARGYSAEVARTEAGRSVAVPGTSEHQLGLAVDIVDLANQNLNESQEKTAVQQWLMKNSWKYGFILRYPNDKSEITGIIYEPWHYRYVGKETAKEIYEQGVCFEEYLNKTKGNI